jgi:acyl carrier protein
MDGMSDPAALDVVVDLIRESLGPSGRDGERIASDTLLFYQLSFTSMDLLDLLFRIEQHFDISVPEGTLYGLARGEMPDGEFASDGVLTPTGRVRLMALLHDTPADVFPQRIHAGSLPRFCTVGAIARLVDARLAAREPCSS